jgi:hypothetical protein
MWEWCDKLKLGKSSAFTKRDIRALPQTEAELEADFFCDSKMSTKSHELWVGIVIEREHGAVLALERVPFPPPTVNDLATLLAHAMQRPPNYEDRQRPTTIYLRDRSQWQELLPHLRQLGIEAILDDELPRFDEAVIAWMEKTKAATSFVEALIQWIQEAKTRTKVPFPVEIKAILRKPFPERQRTSLTDTMELMEWSDQMFKGAYPSRKNPDPLYDPITAVPIQLAADEVDSILTKTEIANTKKLRPQLEAMAAKNKTIDLDITEWSRIILAMCGARVKEESVQRHLEMIARKIAGQLAQALGIDPPPSAVE